MPSIELSDSRKEWLLQLAGFEMVYLAPRQYIGSLRLPATGQLLLAQPLTTELRMWHGVGGTHQTSYGRRSYSWQSIPVFIHWQYQGPTEWAVYAQLVEAANEFMETGVIEMCCDQD